MADASTIVSSTRCILQRQARNEVGNGDGSHKVDSTRLSIDGLREVSVARDDASMPLITAHGRLSRNPLTDKPESALTQDSRDYRRFLGSTSAIRKSALLVSISLLLGRKSDFLARISLLRAAKATSS